VYTDKRLERGGQADWSRCYPGAREHTAQPPPDRPDGQSLVPITFHNPQKGRR